MADAVSAPAGGGLRRLASASVIYGLGSVLSRGLAFLLLPLYTRHLTTADYGIVAVTATVSSVLGVIYPLGLQGAVARFYFNTTNEDERRATSGTLWIATLVSAGFLALLLDRVGGPVFAALLPAVPFDPYIRLAVWTAFLTTAGLVPLQILQLQERPRAYVALSLSASLLTTGGIVALVVWRNEGAYGYLRGGLLGATAAAVPYAVVAWRNVKPAVRGDLLRAALLYSLPLVPHALAGWALELSDRAILSRFVALGDIGVYAVGYQLGAAMAIVVAAFNSAWVPILFRELAKEDRSVDNELARLVSFYMMVFLFMAVGWALLSPHVITWMLPEQYAGAYRVTQVIVAAHTLNALYIIPINLLFWRKSTWMVPVVTLSGAVVNIALNLALVPRYGAMAAAWDTLAGYAVMLVMAWAFARRQHAFPYPYLRLAKMAVLAVAVFAAAALLVPAVTLTSFAVRCALWLSFPAGLLLVGAVPPSGWRTALASWRGRRGEGGP